MSSSCSYNHPVMRRDDSWRDVLPEKQVLTRHKAGIVSGIPRATNGILVYIETQDGRELIYQLSNLDFDDIKTFIPRRAPAKKLTSPRPRKSPPSIIDISDLL